MLRVVHYVILLPLSSNDGPAVPPELFLDTYRESIGHFGGATWDSAEVSSAWEHGGIRYGDRLRRVMVTGEDTPENEAFMREFKEVLKRRFDQLEIWMEAHHIRLL